MAAKTMQEKAAERRCPACLAWFMTRAQRDAHVDKRHRSEDIDHTPDVFNREEG